MIKKLSYHGYMLLERFVLIGSRHKERTRFRVGNKERERGGWEGRSERERKRTILRLEPHGHGSPPRAIVRTFLHVVLSAHLSQQFLLRRRGVVHSSPPRSLSSVDTSCSSLVTITLFNKRGIRRRSGRVGAGIWSRSERCNARADERENI